MNSCVNNVDGERMEGDNYVRDMPVHGEQDAFGMYRTAVKVSNRTQYMFNYVRSSNMGPYDSDLMLGNGAF